MPEQHERGQIMAGVWTQERVRPRMLWDEAGATAVEYSLLAALVGLVVIGAITAMGGSLTTSFQGTASSLSSSASNASTSGTGTSSGGTSSGGTSSDGTSTG